MKVNSTVKMDFSKIKQLGRAQIKALEMTAEALHTEVIQSEIMPRDTGALQNENMFVDCDDSANGRAQLVNSLPYARRLYYHPEYNFQTIENAFASGKWYKPWLKGGISAGFCKDAYKKFYKKESGV